MTDSKLDNAAVMGTVRMANGYATGVLFTVSCGVAKAVFVFDYAGGTRPDADEWVQLLADGQDTVVSILDDFGSIGYVVRLGNRVTFSSCDRDGPADISATVHIADCEAAIASVVARLHQLEEGEAA